MITTDAEGMTHADILEWQTRVAAIVDPMGTIVLGYSDGRHTLIKQDGETETFASESIREEVE